MNSIAVFCGSSLGNDAEIINEAERIGITFAKQEITLIYGAAKIGIMGKIANTVLSNNGSAIGIIPKFLETKEIVHQQLTELIVTETMHQRKQLMYTKSDGFIIMPGGFGTLDEFFEIATWGQLGLHTKPIGILNTNGYYDALITQCETMVARGFLKQANLDAILVDETCDGLLTKMKNFTPLPKPKWLTENEI